MERTIQAPPSSVPLAAGLILTMALGFAPTALCAQGSTSPAPVLDVGARVAGSAMGPRRLESAQQSRPPAKIELRIPGNTRPASPFVAALASLALPGLGQALLDQERWAAYAGMELVGWFVQIERLRAGQRARTAYRDLAWFAARGTTGAREDRDWSYYKALASWSRSGAYDSDPTRDGLQPETDRRTFNGDLWNKAREIYVLVPDARGDPRAQGRAVTYYEISAIRPGFYWDWTAGAVDHLRYRRLFRESNEALRAASFMLTGLLANHLFSMTDAFVSSRLAREAPIRVSAAWRSFPVGPAFELGFELRR